jgi:hypothetical protein
MAMPVPFRIDLLENPASEKCAISHITLHQALIIFDLFERYPVSGISFSKSAAAAG